MKQALRVNATTAKNSQLGFRIHLIAFLLGTPVIWIVWGLTDTTYPWPLWSTPVWAVGVLFHYLGVFRFKKGDAKKSMLIGSLLLLLTTSNSFALPTEPASEQVMNAFKKDFSTAQDISWETKAAVSKATFQLNGQVLFAYYSGNGTLLAVIRNLTSNQLPIRLLSDLKNNYAGYWISDLFEMVADSTSTYYLTVENSEQKIVLKSTDNANWEVFRKEAK
ncbi:2TM domain-containing protein [Paraflavitalea pollutisoli]|uniref:2TM domain-containing protein n=1 Tax=Paraflavitalea pollutisoli TaxID=3034143 RepID=UPI0023EBB139|nr:2TM domain-containing protein [Paraflavitalea sp. H1-2-19X]